MNNKKPVTTNDETSEEHKPPQWSTVDAGVGSIKSQTMKSIIEEIVSQSGWGNS